MRWLLCALCAAGLLCGSCAVQEPPSPGAAANGDKDRPPPLPPTPAVAESLLAEAQVLAEGDPVTMVALLREYARTNFAPPAEKSGRVHLAGRLRASPPPPSAPASSRTVAERVIELVRRYTVGELGPEIWNGVPAGDKYPECVDVGRWSAGFKSGGWCCSGVLIARNAVLTADHCFGDRCIDDPRANGDTTSVWVYAGPGKGQPGKKYRVSSFHRYREATPQGSRNDLAVLILAKDVDIVPAKFARAGAIDEAKSLLVVGFGLNENASFGVKLYGRVAMASSACAAQGEEARYGCARLVEFVAADPVIPGAPQLKPVDSCSGDSGGPAYVDDAEAAGEPRLAGITSRGVKSDAGEECGRGGIYIRLDHAEYQRWIKSVPGVHW